MDSEKVFSFLKKIAKSCEIEYSEENAKKIVQEITTNVGGLKFENFQKVFFDIFKENLEEGKILLSSSMKTNFSNYLF